MKAIHIAIKDLTRAFRNASMLVMMFGIPLLITGMFYLMFGNIAGEGFNLPRTKLLVANLDHGGPRLQAGKKNLPEGVHADTMSELVVGILKSKDVADLLEVSDAPDAATARARVDSRQAQVAVIIPPGFSQQFADQDGQAVIEMYSDPTLAIGPAIVRTIMSRFIDGIAGIKIAVDVAEDRVEPVDGRLVLQVVNDYLAGSRSQTKDLAGEFLEVTPPAGKVEKANPVLAIVAPIMGGMMIMYAFLTGSSTAQSILKEDEERTLARLFTTPTTRSAILTGKFLAVFLTVLVQVTTLIVVSHLVFGIEWGATLPVACAAAGIVFGAASAGIFINSLLKTTRQGGMIFGGLLTVTGMVGMIRIFAMNSPSAARLGDTVSLLVPQGWAVRGLLEAMNGKGPLELLPTLLVLLAWSAAFFVIGVWRFKRRYG